MKSIKKTILLASVLALPVQAATKLPQFFIGVSGGHQWAMDDNYHHSNPEGSILGVYSGLRFSPSWSWDVGYQYHDTLKADATSVNVKTWLAESALRYDWELQHNLSLFGRLGAAYWNMEKMHLSSNKLNATGVSPFGEVGINYNFNPNIRLSAGYQYINNIGKANTRKYDSNGLLISLTYTFGGATHSAPAKSAPTTNITPAKDIATVKPSPKTHTVSSKNTNEQFGVDSVKLSNNVIKELVDISSILKTYPQAHAVVVGNTDSTGSTSYNQKLSARRAQSVVNKLINLGVKPTQLEWKGEGESQSIATNDTASGRAINRRVEVTISQFQFQR